MAYGYTPYRRPRTMANVMASGGLSTAPAPTQPASTVAPAAPPVRPGAPPARRAGGWNPSPEQTQNRLRRLGDQNAHRGNRLLWAQLYDLLGDAQADPTYDIAAGYGQEFEAVGDYYDQAGNRLTANLNARGLGDSSAMAQGLAAVEGERAGAQAGLAGDVRREARGQQRLSAQQARQLLAALSGEGAGMAAGIAGNQAQLQLQREMFDEMNDFGFGDILGGIGGLAGLAGQLGWDPFGSGAPRPRTAMTRGDYVSGGRYYG